MTVEIMLRTLIGLMRTPSVTAGMGAKRGSCEPS